MDDDIRIQVREWKQTAKELKADLLTMESTFHRFPACLRALGDRYVVPMVVAIGPYHRDKPHLQEMEKLKRAAAHRFIRDSGLSPEQIYAAVLPVANQARRLYVGDEVASMDAGKFATMMLRDACFLLQFVLMDTDPSQLHASLLRLFVSNRVCIENDIMLLENQIPWSVVHKLNELGCRASRPVPVDKFISIMGSTFKIRGHRESKEPFLQYAGIGPELPHLLGIFRVEKIGTKKTAGVSPSTSMSISASAIELAQMAIKLTPCYTAEFMDMGIWIGRFFGNLYLAPLFLDDTRACWLVNMAALEVCTASLDNNQADSKTAVCSYLALLAMLMNREGDVHQLRTKRLVHAKLTDKETLDFFKSLVKRLDGGPLYNGIMAEIHQYKHKRPTWIKLHAFVQKYKKTILTLLPVIGILVGIFKTLLSLKAHR